MPARRLLPVAALTVAALVCLAAPAAAHVSWQPAEAATGGPTQLGLRVPNERDEAATIAVELVFPNGHQLRDVTAPAPAGWEATVEGGEVVARIRWTATAGGLSGDQALDLAVAIGTVHGAGGGERLVFRALQTYDDGEVVRWIEDTSPGGAEPEHPAPVLTLTGPASAAPVATTTSVGDDPVVAAPTTGADAGAATGDDDGSSPPIAVLVGLFVAAVVGTTVVVVGRGRRSGG